MLECFLFFSALGLFVFGWLLYWLIPYQSLILNQSDALFPVSSRFMLKLIYTWAIALSGFLLTASPKHAGLKLILLTSLSGTICLYQAALFKIRQPDFLCCLGNLNDRVCLSPRVLAILLELFFGIIFGVSSASLFLNFHSKIKGQGMERWGRQNGD